MLSVPRLYSPWASATHTLSSQAVANRLFMGRNLKHLHLNTVKQAQKWLNESLVENKEEEENEYEKANVPLSTEAGTVLDRKNAQGHGHGH